MSKLSYELLRGRLVLADGVTITESGTTDDPAIIKALRELAETRDALGNPQYIRLLDGGDSAEVNAGIVKPGEGAVIDPAPTPDNPAPAPITLNYPPGVHEGDIQKVLSSLEKGNLNFETANALSDEDIKAQTEGIGDARIKLIRAVGKANGYAEYTAPEGE